MAPAPPQLRNIDVSEQQVESGSTDAGSTRRPVLVPVDFSACSKSALLFALNISRCVQAPVLVLHVVHEPNNEPGFYRRRQAPDRPRAMAAVAEDMLKGFIQEIAQSGVPAERLARLRTLLIEGLPVQRIQEVALREDAALIVVGTHGRRGLARLILGSVAGDLAKQSEVPVTIVGPQHESALRRRMASGSPEWWVRGGLRERVPDTEAVRI